MTNEARAHDAQPEPAADTLAVGVWLTTPAEWDKLRVGDQVDFEYSREYQDECEPGDPDGGTIKAVIDAGGFDGERRVLFLAPAAGGQSFRTLRPGWRIRVTMPAAEPLAVNGYPESLVPGDYTDGPLAVGAWIYDMAVGACRVTALRGDGMFWSAPDDGSRSIPNWLGNERKQWVRISAPTHEIGEVSNNGVADFEIVSREWVLAANAWDYLYQPLRKLPAAPAQDAPSIADLADRLDRHVNATIEARQAAEAALVDYCQLAEQLRALQQVVEQLQGGKGHQRKMAYHVALAAEALAEELRALQQVVEQLQGGKGETFQPGERVLRFAGSGIWTPAIYEGPAPGQGEGCHYVNWDGCTYAPQLSCIMKMPPAPKVQP